MEAARLVLDRLKLDAEYVSCDIGWEFWCKEGNALPDRTVKVLKETTCGLFGAITSKPQSEAKEELAPELKDKGLVYFSPIVGLRQMFNLHTNMLDPPFPARVVAFVRRIQDPNPVSSIFSIVSMTVPSSNKKPR